MEECVVLVDEENNELGYMPKEKVHGLNTPLHRAFSVFIFNENRELLLQQRSRKKVTWPFVWSNSCCGHPLPSESNCDAIVRRVSTELGASIRNLHFISPYRYRFTRDNITENEICPIYIASITSDLKLNNDEVENIKWCMWEDWLFEIEKNSEKYSEWCIEESLILAESEVFQKYFQSL